MVWAELFFLLEVVVEVGAEVVEAVVEEGEEEVEEEEEALGVGEGVAGSETKT